MRLHQLIGVLSEPLFTLRGSFALFLSWGKFTLNFPIFVLRGGTYTHTHTHTHTRTHTHTFLYISIYIYT